MPCLRGSVGPGNTLHIIHRRSGKTWLTDKLCCVFSRTGLDIYVFGLQGKLVNADSTVSPEQDSNPTSSTWRRQPGQPVAVPEVSRGRRVCVPSQLEARQDEHCPQQCSWIPFQPFTRFSWAGTQLPCGPAFYVLASVSNVTVIGLTFSPLWHFPSV